MTESAMPSGMEVSYEQSRIAALFYVDLLKASRGLDMSD